MLTMPSALPAPHKNDSAVVQMSKMHRTLLLQTLESIVLRLSFLVILRVLVPCINPTIAHDTHKPQQAQCSTSPVFSPSSLALTNSSTIDSLLLVSRSAGA